ncbi:MAG: DNA repair protein RecO [Candidatus Beckwithbacteria bacterium]
MIKTYKAVGVVLRQINLGEADRLLTIFTQQQGKLRLMAKGVRRLTSRKRGHLEAFTLVSLSCVAAKNLDLITEAATINNFPVLRKNLNRVRIAYLFAELIDQLTAENQENSAVYHLLIRSLSQLNAAVAPQNLILNFEQKLLEILGFGLPQTISQEALEAHIYAITEKTLNAKKIK